MSKQSTTTKRGRPATGSLYYAKSGWRARMRVDVDGERVQKSFDLGTHDRAVAKAKMKRLLAAKDAPSETLARTAKREETFREAALRVVERHRLTGMATWSDRLSRLEMYTFPELGEMVPAEIRARHILALLERVRDLGKARETLFKIKHDISVVLGELWRAELLPENVSARVKVPEALPGPTLRSKKERAVLTDQELGRYLAWVHPDEHHRMAVLERQTMACVARMFGGLRTGDLHVLAWEGFDLPRMMDDGAVAGGFEAGIAPRRKGSRLAKGGRPQRLVVPEMLRPILRDWWERHGRPMDGLIFPVRRGPTVGQQKNSTRHADAFRRDLMRAFGIEEKQPSTHHRGTRGPLGLDVWMKVREFTSRERELFEETEFTKPVDFHSWRRAYNQALAEAGVNAQQAQALAGHASLEAHARYLANTSTAREIPINALPNLSIDFAQIPRADLPIQPLDRGRSRIRTCDPCRVKAVLYR